VQATARLRSVSASRELLWNLVLRELRAKYRRSILGWSWSLLNPLATVVTYSFVFGVLFDSNPPKGDPSGIELFAFFLLCALLPWNFFAAVTNGGMGILIQNAGLVRKVAFPRETLVLANVGQALVQFGIEMALLAVVLLVVGSPLIPWLPVTIFLMLLLSVFAAGFALALSALAVYYRDLSYLWGIFLQLWFFATPIVYDPSFADENLPSWAVSLLEANPMTAFVNAFRATMYDGTAPGLRGVLYCIGLAAASFAFGWYVFGKLSRRFAEEL
jgi:ABC-type polysaccharide/polyol phosphate export permease